MIATNSTFSNPTRDWLTKWQTTHPRPRVKLWAREDLERLVTQHPQVAIRLFSKALSPQGQIEVMKERFWRFTHYTDAPTLSALWEVQQTLELDQQALLAATASEFANGSITDRAWPLLQDGETHVNLFLGALANAMSFVLRAQEAGVRETPYIQAMAYLLMLSLQVIEPDALLAKIEDVFRDSIGEKADVVQEVFLDPVIEQLRAELRDVCTSDCRRVLMDPVELGDKGVKSYWDRNRLKLSTVDEVSKSFLIIEDCKEHCKVGFSLDRKHTCPLANPDQAPTVLDTLKVFKAVLEARIPRS